VLAAALSTAVFLTPAALHRMTTSQHARDRLRVGTRLAQVGFGLLAVATTAGTLLVTRVVHSDAPAIVITAGLGAMLVTLWWMVPTWRDRRARR
jgi:hypothetical protein